MVHCTLKGKALLGILLYMHLMTSAVAIPSLVDTRVEGNLHLEPSGVDSPSNPQQTLRTNPIGVSPATTVNPVRKRLLAHSKEQEFTAPLRTEAAGCRLHNWVLNRPLGPLSPRLLPTCPLPGYNTFHGTQADCMRLDIRR